MFSFFRKAAGAAALVVTAAKAVGAVATGCIMQPIRVLNTATNLIIDAAFCYVPTVMTVFNPFTSVSYFPTTITDLFKNGIPNCAPLSNATDISFNYVVCDSAAAASYNCHAWPFYSSAVLVPTNVDCRNFSLPAEVSQRFYSLAEEACNMYNQLQNEEYNVYNRNVGLIIGGVALGTSLMIAGCCFFARKYSQQNNPENQPLVSNTIADPAPATAPEHAAINHTP